MFPYCYKVPGPFSAQTQSERHPDGNQAMMIQKHRLWRGVGLLGASKRRRPPLSPTLSHESVHGLALWMVVYPVHCWVRLVAGEPVFPSLAVQPVHTNQLRNSVRRRTPAYAHAWCVLKPSSEELHQTVFF